MAAFNELEELLRLRALQALALVLLLSTLGWQYFSTKLCITDLDLWWHIKVGDWIVEHRSFPHTGIFSRTAAGRPWIAYSWGYEVLLSRAYHWFGLMGSALFSVIMMLLVAWSVFWMLQRLSSRFWESWLLAIAGAWAFLWYATARPMLFSILFFTVVLTLILEAQRTANARLLFWLPPIFLLWSNIHIQFVYGLFLVFLFVGLGVVENVAVSASVAQKRPSPEWLQLPAFRSQMLIGVAAACLLATLIGPYSFHLYQVIFEYTKQKVPYYSIIELQPLSFRLSGNYVLLLLAGGGFFAVGLRKQVDLFKLVMLVVASVVAFRTMRDSWFIGIPALACIADWRPSLSPRQSSEDIAHSGVAPALAARRSLGSTIAQNAAIAVALALVLVLIARNTDFNRRALETAVRQNFPVDAADFIRRNHLPGPLYNTLNWGGFLIWYLPEYPVIIDGRNDLYGDEVGARFYKVLTGDPDYAVDPDLNSSRVILLQKPFLIGALLSVDPRFNAVYEDKISAVFVRR